MSSSVQGPHAQEEQTKWTLLSGGFRSNGCFRSCLLGPESWGGVEGGEGFSLGLMAVGTPGPHRGGPVGGLEEGHREMGVIRQRW